MAYRGLISGTPPGEGVEVDMFFTFWGFDMINPKYMADLKFTMLGNRRRTCRRPGRRARHDGDGHPPAASVDRRADVPRRCRSSSSRSRRRRSPVGLPHVGGHAAPLRGRPGDGIEGIISASDFIEKTAGAQLLFI